jgi:5-methylthioadenosine/S-adenosylhomocysteine deaminase
MKATADSGCDLFIKDALVVTMNPSGEVFKPGALAVKGDTIVAVGREGNLAGMEERAKEVLDARGGAVLPGLINVHTHAAMTLFRGLADDLPLMEWLTRHIFPAEKKMTGEWVYWGSLLACAEMILSGTTTFCDMYLFESRTAQAVQEAGMRALIGEVLYDFPSPNYGPLEEGFEYTRRLIETYSGHPLISVAVEPHAPFTCSPELLKKARALSEEFRVPLIIHLAETENEVEAIKKQYHCTPVEHLDKLGLLSDRLIAVHCVVLSEGDLDLLSRAGVKIAHCPESNMKLASGVAPVVEMLKKGMAVGLGTDGCASNNNLDLFQEMDTTAKLHKVHHLDPTVLDAPTVLEMATIRGARVLGLENRIGSLESGKKADIILLDLHQPHLTPMYHIHSHLVYAARGADVTHVLINGQWVMKNRRLATLNLEEILKQVRRLALEIKAP